ncbi:MAG: hypothetical protein ACJ74O_12995 [Frankiaceae bacterium]
MAQPTAATASKVSTATPPDITPANHQNEPALAVDAHQPNVLVSGWNDWGDTIPCPQQTAAEAGSCFAGPVAKGLSAVSFSFDSGHSWVQPTYTGWTGRNCAPDPDCPGEFGPIVTLPWYYEDGLTSGGDPAVAIGPQPGTSGFSWDNGSRVYYANLVGNIGAPFPSPPDLNLKGSGIAVSRLDDPTPSRVLDKSSWMHPVIPNTRLNQTAFEDKEQIWADNAASSRYFGNVYLCTVQYRSVGQHNANQPGPLQVAVSSDGGSTWSTRQLASAGTTGHGPTEFGLSGCTIRTESTGVVHVFAELFQNPSLSGLPTHGAHVMFTSYDGGRRWSRMQTLWRITDPCSFIDRIESRCVMDGYTGARTDIASAPSIDIANGAPTGEGATNEIVDAWADASGGLNNEKAMLAWHSGGAWHGPTAVSLAGDRPLFAAAAISPVGDRAYVVYEAVRSPWLGTDMTTPRPYRGVLRAADVGADGAPGGWTAPYIGPTGDLRGTYPGHDIYQERVGDYVYAVATRTYGAGVWTDARDAQVCPAVQDYRAASIAAGARALPAPWPLLQCPRFGNTDIWSATTG